MFYSPFDICEVCRQYVLLDQTNLECAREHACRVAHCPLKRFFATAHERPVVRTEHAETKS